jgi:hypothetical protein
MWSQAPTDSLGGAPTVPGLTKVCFELLHVFCRYVMHGTVSTRTDPCGIPLLVSLPSSQVQTRRGFELMPS